MVAKVAEVVFRRERGYEWLSFDPDPGPDGQPEYVAKGVHDLITSRGNAGWRKLSRNGRAVGGPFMLRKHLYEEFSDLDDRYLTSAGTVYRYRGPQYAKYETVNPSDFPDVTPSPDHILEAFGTTAIARVLPTNPLASLSTYLGEMREGIPAIVGSDFLKSRARRARSAGGEYLNFEFGWRPLVSDVRAFADAVMSSHKTISQYERQSGDGVRRRYVLNMPDEVSVEETTGNPEPLLIGPIYTSAFGPMTKTTTISRKLWFSGCFTYHLEPLNDGALRKGWFQRANKLFGIRLTPETLWDVSPWSWAADWFGNIGDNFHNVMAFQNDGLVMRYGYVMETKIHRVAYNLSGIGYGNLPGRTYSFMQSLSTVTKKRIEATPLGFGLNPISDFTNRQWAITAALGLTHGSR